MTLRLYTGQQFVTGVRILLRRPSDLELADDDILKIGNDLCVQYAQEQSLSTRDRRTEVAPITITPGDTVDDADFVALLDGVSDFEVEALEYAPLASTDGIIPWREAVVVPRAAWRRHFTQDYVAAAFYGSSSLQTPCKVKLTLLDSQVERLQFRVTYRLPLLTIMQMGDKPPIPLAHMPMLEREAAILCAPLVQNDSESWKSWKRENIDGEKSPYWMKVSELKANWKAYLDTSVEPQIQPIPRSDRANRSIRRFVRPFIPSQ